VICRYGNDSQLAVQYLRQYLKGDIRDIMGGLNAWSKEIDHSFPIY